MILGGLPRLKLDRAGVALLGAIGVIGLGVMTTEQAARPIDLPTILLLFSFMVVSAQFPGDGAGCGVGLVSVALSVYTGFYLVHQAAPNCPCNQVTKPLTLVVTRRGEV